MLNAKSPLSAGIPKNPKNKNKNKKEEREHDTLSLSVGRDPRSCVFCMIEKTIRESTKDSFNVLGSGTL
jgi:hypothetical protein